MIGTVAPAAAAPVRVLITNGGVHTPETWAHETANALVSIDRTMTHGRIEAAVELKRKIGEVLVEHFRQIRARSLQSELHVIACSAIAAVADCAKASPWALHFSEPNTRQAMALTIYRNINTAAELALRTE